MRCSPFFSVCVCVVVAFWDASFSWVRCSGVWVVSAGVLLVCV